MEGGAYNLHELWLHAWNSNCEITDIIYIELALSCHVVFTLHSKHVQ